MSWGVIGKVLLVLAVCLFMVQMGMSNKDATVSFNLDLIHLNGAKLPAAMMYFVFFGIGAMTGLVVAMHGSKGGSKKKAE